MNAKTLVRQTTVLVAGLFALAIGHDFSCPFAGAQEFPPTERTEVGTKWKVFGKVTTANSRPISGVQVYLSRGTSYQAMSSNRYSDLKNPVTTGFSGKFEIDVQERHRLVFLKSRFAPHYAPVPEGSSLDVQLTAGRPVSGTIQLPSGAPATNAIVTPVLWLIPKPESQQYQPNPGDRGHARNFIGGLPNFGEDWKVKTDGAGKFSLPHLSSEYRVGLSVKSEGWKEEVVYVRAEEDTAPPDFDNQVLVDNQFTYSMEPCSLLKIKATDESGNPASIERVSIYPINDVSNAFDFRRTESFGRGDVVGQILDSDGVGIFDLDVSARSGGNSFSQTGQLWKTKTRKDGMFKMQGLPAASKLHWSLDATRVKTRGSRGGIEIDTSQLVNGRILTTEPIVCEDYTVLAGDLPEIEIGGLSNEAALEILTAYIEDSIERIPESGKKPSGGSSGEPVPTYVQKVIAKAIPIIKELADREPGSDFELELLTKIPPHLLSGGHASLISGNEAAKLETFCKERLLKNHVDKENAQEQLILAHLFSRHGFHRERDKQWQKLYDASPFAETKAVAAFQSVVHFSSKIRRACYAKENQEDFERTFAEFDQQLKRVEEYAKDLDPKWEGIVGSSFKRNLRGLETQLQPRRTNQAQDPRKNNASQFPRQPEFDESRAAKTLKRIQSALEKIE